MTDLELRRYCSQQSEAKLPFLARYVVQLPTNEDRRHWLTEFGKKHTAELAERIRQMALTMLRSEVAA